MTIQDKSNNKTSFTKTKERNGYNNKNEHLFFYVCS